MFGKLECDIYGDRRYQAAEPNVVTATVDDVVVSLKVCDYHLEYFKTTDPSLYTLGRTFTGEVELREIPVPGGYVPPVVIPPLKVIPPGIYDYYGATSIGDWPHEGGTDPYYDTSSYFNIVPYSVDPLLGDMVEIVDKVNDTGRAYQELLIKKSGLYLLSLTVTASLTADWEGISWYAFLNGYNESENSSMQMRLSADVPTPIVDTYTQQSKDLFVTLTDGLVLTPFVLVYNAEHSLNEGEFGMYIQINPLIMEAN